MEDDDEFGDLYTDVLRPFSQPQPQPQPQPHQPIPAPTPVQRPIDLNIKSDDRDSLDPSSNPNSTLPFSSPSKSLLPDLDAPPLASSTAVANDVDKDGELTDTDVKFDIEDDNNGILNDDVTIIPGISVKEEGGGARRDEDEDGKKQNENATGGEEDEDWDSDSEDDLQIVLNDDNRGPMMIGDGGANGDGDDDDDDEDGDPLVIVADDVAGHNQGLMEEQEWGGDDAVGQAAEGAEKKEIGDRANGVSAVTAAAAAKIGYSNHYAYHNPYHSQFKYVRPGAAPVPGSTSVGPGGLPAQIRPPIIMGPAGGRGRGEWRPTGMKNAPPMQKGYHSGFGTPGGGNSVAGRGFGLEFTLPSHKTIFEVDIDGFEEKPWKYPGVDVSDFFNFGLNEESWKDYCKQLEQHRLETTMQSRIRVYESGRTDQDYDPDLPPELAAATGMLDVPAENAKSDIGQTDLTKGSTRIRPPLPTGRAIQVEGGCGERLPSIDTRPPRIRDSDAIIEIICQDSLEDDTSAGNGYQDNDLQREDLKGKGHVAENETGPMDTEYFDSYQEPYNSRRRETIEQSAQDPVKDNISEENQIMPVPSEASARYCAGSRSQTPPYPADNDHEERRISGRTRERSPQLTPSRSPQVKELYDIQQEESIESMKGKNSASSSPVAVRDARESSVEHKEELVPGNGSSDIEKDEANEITTSDTDTLKDRNSLHSMKKQKITSQVQESELQELDDDDDSKAARSSENSKARSGSSRDYKKWRDGMDEEVMQDRRSSRMGSIGKHPEENEYNFQRKDRDVRQEMSRSRFLSKGREGSYPRRDMESSLPHHLHMKAEGYDRRRDDGVWQRRDVDPYSRKNRIEDSRKREREHAADDMVGSKHRGKTRESERIEKEEILHSRKHLDNGNYRVHKTKYDVPDDYHKRRKDDEYVRREHAEKDEILLSHRDVNSRRKRERDDQLRLRESFEDHHIVRHKDEVWLQRERSERQREREREEWHRLKSHDEIVPKREREEARVSVRSGRSSEDKAWVGHARVKDENRISDKEYQLKDTVRQSEQLKRRERIEDDGFPHHRSREDVYTRGNQLSNEERKSRQERAGPRNDRASNTPDNSRVNDRKYKETSRKNREPEGADHNYSGASKRNQENQSGHISEMGLKGNADNGKPVHRNFSRRQKEEVSSDEEHQDSKRGRSKLERWTSHKERDYTVNSKSSASLKFKQIEKSNNNNSSGGALVVNKLQEEKPSLTVEVEKKDSNSNNPESKGVDSKPSDDRHLDTVEKLKKRSERFKLPMPSEKDPVAIKKMETEPLPSVKTETPADSVIKPERPARKRRFDPGGGTPRHVLKRKQDQGR